MATTLADGDIGLEMPEAILGPLSLGAAYFRHTPATSRFVRSWDDVLTGHLHRSDQPTFAALAAALVQPFRRHPANARLAASQERAISIGVLPLASFLHGHAYFVQRLHQVCRCLV